MRLMMLNGSEDPIKLTTKDNKIIECDNQVKVFGWWSNPSNSMATHLSRIKSVVHFQLSTLRPAMRYLSMCQRREVVRSKVLSKLYYGLCLFSGQTEKIKSELYALIMYCYRVIYGQNTYMMRNSTICKKIEMDEPNQVIVKAAVSLIQKIHKNQYPKDISNLFRHQRLGRRDHPLALEYAPRTNKFRRVYLNSAVDIFNSIDPKIRNLDWKRFKLTLSKCNLNFDPG